MKPHTCNILTRSFALAATHPSTRSLQLVAREVTIRHVLCSSFGMALPELSIAGLVALAKLRATRYCGIELQQSGNISTCSLLLPPARNRSKATVHDRPLPNVTCDHIALGLAPISNATNRTQDDT
ncbi:hypothetical protein HGRIS_006870 [Hohenbuehelia grisea]|uniref:Uncharacterized protein n=1 Tax=Hohenbuehelia grisea TaxID=104357 RepID=A0ABR3JAV4_9AGAR